MSAGGQQNCKDSGGKCYLDRRRAVLPVKPIKIATLSCPLSLVPCPLSLVSWLNCGERRFDAAYRPHDEADYGSLWHHHFFGELGAGAHSQASLTAVCAAVPTGIVQKMVEKVDGNDLPRQAAIPIARLNITAATTKLPALFGESAVCNGPPQVARRWWGLSLRQRLRQCSR